VNLPRALSISTRSLQKKIPIFPERIRKSALRILKNEKFKVHGEITFSFVNDSEIKKLNAKYLNKNSVTDVLAFNATNTSDKGEFFADIIISTDTAIRNAKIFKTSNEYELSLYIVHGLLHLLGYNDNTIKNKEIMRRKELKYVDTQN
jgi:probable rRNA maturation factor